MPFPGSESVAAALTPPADPSEHARWLSQWRRARQLAAFFALVLVGWAIRVYSWSLSDRTTIAAKWLIKEFEKSVATAALLAGGAFWISLVACGVLACCSNYRPGVRSLSRIQHSLMHRDENPEPIAPRKRPDACYLYAIPFAIVAGLCHLVIKFLYHFS